MSKRATPLKKPEIMLDQNASAPLYRQLYQRLRGSILSGHLEAGTRLPSTRVLASALGVSAFHPTADGSVRVDVGISGSWQGFEPPAIVGTAQLQNVRTGMR